MDEIEYEEAISRGVAGGVGFAGCHRVKCDTIRKNMFRASITGGDGVTAGCSGNERG
jgi:type 1 glutamine amidotransferase